MTLIDKEFALEHMVSDRYHRRQSDEFQTPSKGKLSNAILQRVLNELTVEVVTNSIVTKIPLFILELLTKITTDTATEPIKTEYELEINTYPYVLPDEVNTQLARALSSKIHQLFSVSITCFDYKTLTPEIIKQTYPCFVLYDSTKWFNDFEKHIVSFELKNTHVYIPKLNFVREFTDEEKLNIEEGIDPFLAFEIAMAPWIDVVFVPVAMYCADTPSNKNEYLD